MCGRWLLFVRLFHYSWLSAPTRDLLLTWRAHFVTNTNRVHARLFSWTCCTLTSRSIKDFDPSYALKNTCWKLIDSTLNAVVADKICHSSPVNMNGARDLLLSAWWQRCLDWLSASSIHTGRREVSTTHYAARLRAVFCIGPAVGASHVRLWDLVWLVVLI